MKKNNIILLGDSTKIPELCNNLNGKDEFNIKRVDYNHDFSQINCKNLNIPDIAIVIINDNNDVKMFRSKVLPNLSLPSIAIISPKFDQNHEELKHFKYILTPPINFVTVKSILQLIEYDCKFENFIMNHIPLGLIYIDNISENIININNEAIKILVEENLLGKNLFEIFPTLKKDLFNIKVAREIEYKDKIIGVSGYLVENTTISLVMIKDITQSVKEKQKIKESKNLIIQGRMLSAITHEIGNPLAAMKTSLQVLKGNVDKFSKEKTLNYINKTLLEIERLDVTIRDFLTYHRIDSLVPDPVDALDVLNIIFKQLEDLFITDNIVLNKNFEDNILFVYSDRNKLKQLFLNIILNARDAVVTNTIHNRKINIKTYKTKSSGIIIFDDNGPGVTENILENMFQPFFTTKGNGTGLGLAISKQIVEKCEGEIEGKNIPTGGFRIQIKMKLYSENK